MKTAYTILLILISLHVFPQELPSFGIAQKMEILNSSANEIMPIFANNRVYFSRTGYQKNKGGASAGMDIWYSDYNPNTESWSKAKNDIIPLNTKGHNAVIGVSADGNTLYLLNQYLKDGTSNVGISFSKNLGYEWSTPTNMPIANFNNKGKMYGFFITKNEKHMIISFQGENSEGLEDLYISHKEDSIWSTPVNLGKQINTDGFEISPFFSEKEQTLYFSSNGRKNGTGDADIYMTKKLSDDWLNWSEPVNLGPKVNTSGFDAYLSKSEEGEYYYVKNNSETGDDIYKINLTANSKNTFIVNGLIYDEATNEPISTNLSITNDKTGELIKQITSSEDGLYEVALKKDEKYIFNVLTKGYHEHHDTITTQTTENSIRYDMPMNPLKVGDDIKLGYLYFIVSTDSLRDISLPEVDKLVKIMNDNPELKISIEGHTDNSGSRSLNDKLSQARADAIRNILIKNSIKKKRMRTVGYGSRKPLVKNLTEEDKKRNRRVEFKIIN